MANNEADRIERQNSYHQRRVYDALINLRLAIHEAHKVEAPIGDLGVFDFEDLLADIKKVGGFYWNADKSSQWYDGPKDGNAVAVASADKTVETVDDGIDF